MRKEHENLETIHGVILRAMVQEEKKIMETGVVGGATLRIRIGIGWKKAEDQGTLMGRTPEVALGPDSHV